MLAEPAWRTLVIDHPDVRLAEAYTRYVTDHQVRNSRLGSQLARLCQAAGLAVATVIPITSVFDDPTAADQVFGFDRVTRRAVERGLMSVEDGRRWLEHLAHGPSFFASVTLFMVVADKPQSSGFRAPDGPDCPAT